MTKTIQLPFLDYTGEITPPLIEAFKHGATVERDPNSDDHIIVTFKSPKDRDAFAKLVAALLDEPKVEVEPEKPVEE